MEELKQINVLNGSNILYGRVGLVYNTEFYH